MADETDYIAGYDPFFISSTLRNKKTDADLDAYYKAATGGGVAARGNYLFGFPRERLAIKNEQDRQQLQGLIEAEKQRRTYKDAVRRNYDNKGGYLDFYSESSPEIDAAVDSNNQARAEYDKKPYGIFGAVEEAITGERAALERDYWANYERKLQLGDLKSKLYAYDKAGQALPQDLLSQYQSLKGEPYEPSFEKIYQLRDLRSKLYEDYDKAGKDLPQDLLSQYQSLGGGQYRRIFPAPAPAAEPAAEPASAPAAEPASAPAEPTVEAPQAENSKESDTFLKATTQRLEGIPKKESPQEEVAPETPASSEVEPANEEEMDRWRETLKNDFVKVMGSSYDPNSSEDFKKMKLLADTKRANPELSTNALALKIYRSGAL